MRIGRSTSAANRARLALLTADAELEQSVRGAFGGSGLEVAALNGTLSANEGAFDVAEAAVIIIDLAADHAEEMEALQRLMSRIGEWPPVVVVAPAFDKDVARQLLHMRVADFLVKPIQPSELMRTCSQVMQGPVGPQASEAEIYGFLAAAGGAGVTTLAIQMALLLRNSGEKVRPSTCLVDLDFQHGSCCDYLDLEPRLDLSEIEPRPERLDRQLLEVMLSHHSSGLAVIGAPNRPAEMRSFDPDLVTRLLDLVASHFNFVVIDMPRTWFSWTDSVLLGSNRLFIVSEMTVPGLKHAKQLVTAIRERLDEGPQPKVIVNRFEQRLFGAGLRRGDVEQALGADFAVAIPNDYALVREAIDRGVPLDEVKAGNKISVQLKRLIAPQPAAMPSATAPTPKKLALSSAR